MKEVKVMMKATKKNLFTKKSKKEMRILRKAQFDVRSGMLGASVDDSELLQSVKEHDSFFRQMVDLLRTSHKYKPVGRQAKAKEKEINEPGKVNKRERRKQLKREKKREKTSANVDVAKSKKIKSATLSEDSKQTVHATNQNGESVDHEHVNGVNVPGDVLKQKSDKRDKKIKKEKKNKLLHTANDALENTNVTKNVRNESDVNPRAKIKKKCAELDKSGKKKQISSSDTDSVGEFAHENRSTDSMKEGKMKRTLKEIGDKNCKVKPSASKKVKTKHVVDKKHEQTDELSRNDILQFSRFDFDEPKKDKQVGKDFKRMLEKLETKKRKLELLRNSNDGAAVTMESSMQWRGAIEKAEGKKVRDDEELLKKAVKKKAQLKKKTKKQWKKGRVMWLENGSSPEETSGEC